MLNAGEDDPALKETSMVKLQAIMDLIRMMHLGCCRVIRAASGSSKILTLMDCFLDELSKIPDWIAEFKRLSCRKGAIQALTLCKTYYPSIEPDRLAEGFPELKADGTKYHKDEYVQAAREVRLHATKIADEMKLDSFEPGYDQRNKRRAMPAPAAVSLKIVSKKPHPDATS